MPDSAPPEIGTGRTMAHTEFGLLSDWMMKLSVWEWAAGLPAAGLELALVRVLELPAGELQLELALLRVLRFPNVAAAAARVPVITSQIHVDKIVIRIHGPEGRRIYV